MFGIVGANEIFVQQSRVGAEQRVEIGVGHSGACGGDLQHPEDCDRIGILVRFADRGRETAQRTSHSRNGLVYRGGLVEVYPRHAEMRRVGKAVVGDIATLECPRPLHVIAAQHTNTIS